MPNDNVTQFTDRMGNITEYTYTTYSNPLTVTHESDGATTTYSYYADGSLKQTVDASNNTTTYTYPTPDRGLPLSVNCRQWLRRLSQYDLVRVQRRRRNHGHVLARADKRRHAQFQQLQFPGLHPDDFDLRCARDLLSSTDGNGAFPGDPAHTTTYTYSSLGRLLTVTQPVPDPADANPLPAPVTENVYDAAGNLISTTLVTASPQQTTSTVYDAMGPVVANVGPDGTYTTAQYDPAGNNDDTTDAMGRVTQTCSIPAANRSPRSIPDGTVVEHCLRWRRAGRRHDRRPGQHDPLRLRRARPQDRRGRTLRQDGRAPPRVDDSNGAVSQPTSGTWTASSSGSGGYKNGYTYASGPASATWAFTSSQNVTAGRYYEVFVTWAGRGHEHDRRSYTVYDGTTSGINRGSVTVDEQVLAAAQLPRSPMPVVQPRVVLPASGTLTVQLTNSDGEQAGRRCGARSSRSRRPSTAMIRKAIFST